MPQNAMETGLYTALNVASVTNLLGAGDEIHNMQIPNDAIYPVVVFQYSAGGDENMTPTRSRDVTYIVKSISKAGFEDAGAIDAAIDTVLHNQTISVTGWTPFWLARTNDIRMVEVTDDGKQYFHSGAFYRVRTVE